MSCRYALFWEITQRIGHAFFCVSGQPIGVIFLAPIGCSETSARKYHKTLRMNSEERRSHLLRGDNLKWRSRGVAPLVRNVGTGSRGMVSSTPCPLIPQESRSGHFGEQNNIMFSPAIEPGISGRFSSIFRISIDSTLQRDTQCSCTD